MLNWYTSVPTRLKFARASSLYMFEKFLRTKAWNSSKNSHSIAYPSLLIFWLKVRWEFFIHRWQRNPQERQPPIKIVSEIAAVKMRIKNEERTNLSKHKLVYECSCWIFFYRVFWIDICFSILCACWFYFITCEPQRSQKTRLGRI